MTRRNFSVLLALLVSSAICAQPTQVTIGSPDNEENYPMIRLSNGDYVLAGCTQNVGFGGKDVLVTRTTSGGNIIWTRQYGGSGDETAISVSQTPDGGFVIGGESFSTDPNGDAFIFKVNSSGIMQWWKEYGDGLYDITYSVCALADGNIISAGLMETGPVDYDAFLMKTDANGDTLWTKVIGVPGIDHAVNVIQTSDSGYIFCGKTLSHGQGVCDCWLVKTDAAGDTMWTRTYGGIGWDESMDIIEQPSGYIVCGGTNSENASNYDFLLMQIDFSGNLVWVKQYGGLNVEDSYCVQEVPGEGYLLAGYTETYSYSNSRGTDSANAFLLKTDYNGDTLWTMVYGGTLKEECFSVAVVPNVGYAIAGYTASFGDSLQSYLFMTDSLGFTSCLERRVQPTIWVPTFVQGAYSYNVTSGYQVAAPSRSEMNAGMNRTVNCTAPLTISENVESSVIIFPNPSCEQITIQASSNIKSVHMYSMIGDEVYSGNATPHYNTNEWHIPPPPHCGSYMVDIELENGAVISEVVEFWY